MTVPYLADRLWHFGLAQASASAFGGYLLALILLTKLWYPFTPLERYDFLFLAAVLFQLFLLAFRLETPREAAVVAVFHALATAMEVFKTSDGIRSWSYPGDAVLKVGNVPLFAGFMYSAVGSYMVRAQRAAHLRYTHYPRSRWLLLLGAGIYANFFTHHYTVDLRWPLFAVSVFLYRRSWVCFRVGRQDRWMPTLLSAVLTAFFIWLAENAATAGRIWVYPNQAAGWRPVGPEKLLAWYLLLVMSFALLGAFHPVKRCDDAGRELPPSGQ